MVESWESWKSNAAVYFTLVYAVEAVSELIVDCQLVVALPDCFIKSVLDDGDSELSWEIKEVREKLLIGHCVRSLCSDDLRVGNGHYNILMS